MEALKSITQFQGQSKARFPHMREAGFFLSMSDLSMSDLCFVPECYARGIGRHFA